jgi:hypothetical protein
MTLIRLLLARMLLALGLVDLAERVAGHGPALRPK